MGAFDFGTLAPADVTTLALLADAAYADEEPPSGWETLTATDLDYSGGIIDGEFVGNYYQTGIESAFLGYARVMRDGDQVVLSFRGTDSVADYALYPEIIETDTFVRNFSPLLEALASYLADEGLGAEDLCVTGHSLGAAAVNELQNLTDGEYADYDGATFVAFASPQIYDANDVLNVGFEDDWVFKALERSEPLSADQPNLPNATNSIIWYDDNYSNRDFAEFAFNPVDDTTAHHVANYIQATLQIRQSMFYSQMTPDSVIIVVATDDQVTDWDSPTSDHFNDPAYYVGRAVADDVLGGIANDTIEGFAGDDTLEGAGGDDRIDGGDGFDTAVYRSGITNFTITDNPDGTITIDQIAGTPDDGTDTLSTVEQADFNGRIVPILTNDLAVIEQLPDGGVRYRGTAESERIGGTDGDDVLFGGGGRDLLLGYDGDDLARGGGGDDVVVGGDGNDTLHGGQGDDDLIGGTGSDVMTGGAGADTFTGGTGDDTVDGGRDDDRLLGGGADDRLDGGSGDDAVYGGRGDDTVIGGSGDDVLFGGSGFDVLIGGGGANLFVIAYSDAVDEIRGFDDGDRISLRRDFEGLAYDDLLIDYDAATETATIFIDEGAEIARVTRLADATLLGEDAFLFA